MFCRDTVLPCLCCIQLRKLEVQDYDTYICKQIHEFTKVDRSYWLCDLLALSGNRPSELISNSQPGNNRPSALVSEPQPKKTGPTFADWCRKKGSLSPETKHTVEVLLQKAETTECDAANQKLSSFTSLSLYKNQISDIKPLESLTNLTDLSLTDNQISDIKPLESLTNLTRLESTKIKSVTSNR